MIGLDTLFNSRATRQVSGRKSDVVSDLTGKRQIHFIDEDVYHANCAVFCNIII